MILTFHPDAVIEQNEAVDWYNSISSNVATTFEQELLHVYAQIHKWPRAASFIIRPNRFRPVKRFPYKVVYEVLDDDHILIVAIAHTSRAPGYWMDRSIDAPPA